MKRTSLLLFALVAVGCAAPDQETPEQTGSDLGSELEEILRREVDPLDTSELLPYLLELEARAKSKGEATALEVEPGVAAIFRFQRELGDEETGRILREFSEQMLAVNSDRTRP